MNLQLFSTADGVLRAVQEVIPRRTWLAESTIGIVTALWFVRWPVICAAIGQRRRTAVRRWEAVLANHGTVGTDHDRTDKNKVWHVTTLPARLCLF